MNNKFNRKINTTDCIYGQVNIRIKIVINSTIISIQTITSAAIWWSNKLDFLYVWNCVYFRLVLRSFRLKKLKCSAWIFYLMLIAVPHDHFSLNYVYIVAVGLSHKILLTWASFLLFATTKLKQGKSNLDEIAW